MNDKEKLLNDIKLYFLNPKKYTGSKKELERQISTLNEYLLNGNSSSDIFEAFAKEYTSDNDLNNPIISAIHKTLSDKQGLSSTRNYKEIYFNEIIQNANDLEGATDLDITISSDDSNYIMAFKYNDNGFSIENIIGFFDTEFHIKKPNLSATGKHGVGIKALFYFVNSLKIESNIIIDFEIKSIKIEDDSSENQYGIKVSSKLEINLNREEATKTILTITFSKNKIDTTYNIAKLQKFIEKCLSDKFEPEAVEQYFFGDNQSEMIFDARNLLFTDANKGKKSSIKKITFKTNEKELFTLSSDNCGNKVQFDDVKISKSVIKYNDDEEFQYLIFTKVYKNDTQKQNFSVAFPINRDFSGASRFYETYYIPDEEHDFRLPILINSEYSNVSRTKLTDGNQQDKEKIISEIVKNINSIYEIMCREDVATSNLGIELSRIFHKLLITYFSNNDINILEANVNNRYLPKFKENNENNKYIVFKRQQKEEYEKVLVGSKPEDKENLSNFYNCIIKSDDTVIYNEDLFIEEAKNAYNKGFNDTNFKLKTILNIAGNVRDLFYYRTLDRFPQKENSMLSDEDVDKYIPQYFSQDDNDCLWVYVCLKMIGRYKLHPNIDIQGNINGASFFEYLFNDNVEISERESAPYPTFAQKQSELYSIDYRNLKARLCELLINRKVKDCQGKIFDNVGETYRKEHEWCKNHQECKGYMCFYGSNDTRASCELYYYQNERQIYDFQKECNTDIFGEELSILLCKKILKEKKILDNIAIIFQKLVIFNELSPNWARHTPCYWRYSALYTGKQFKRRIINIDFLKQIYAHSWEDFKFYYDFVQKFQEQKNVVLELSTVKENNILFDFDVNELTDIFKFFYGKAIPNNVTFKVNLINELSNNLCDKEFFDFVKQMTGYEVYVTQTNNIGSNREYQIMYLNDGKINFSNKSVESLQYANNAKNKIYIVHASSISTKDAMIKVLESVLNKTDILDFCKAFISSGSYDSLFGEVYALYESKSINTNSFSQDISNNISSKGLSCNDMIKIILARGNNNGKCSLCGKQLYDYKKLVIVNNGDENTKEKYSKIYTVTCSECRKVLEKSLSCAKLNFNDNTIDFNCKISNQFQSKDIIIKSNINKGTLFVL